MRWQGFALPGVSPPGGQEPRVAGLRSPAARRRPPAVRSYNVLFGRERGEEATAQIEAFGDTWTWTQETHALYGSMLAGGAPAKVAEGYARRADGVRGRGR